MGVGQYLTIRKKDGINNSEPTSGLWGYHSKTDHQVAESPSFPKRGMGQTQRQAVRVRNKAHWTRPGSKEMGAGSLLREQEAARVTGANRTLSWHVRASDRCGPRP